LQCAAPSADTAWQKVLKDDPENPQFIQTVTGQGYRFIAHLEKGAGAAHDETAAVRPHLPAAYEAYVRGRHAWNKRGETELREAIRFFQQSIDADPTFAPAYAGIADSYTRFSDIYYSPKETFVRRAILLTWSSKDRVSSRFACPAARPLILGPDHFI
jgi:hypothetical protein